MLTKSQTPLRQHSEHQNRHRHCPPRHQPCARAGIRLLDAFPGEAGQASVDPQFDVEEQCFHECVFDDYAIELGQ